ncbi:MAG: ATP-binding protein [Faecalibacterium sp.]|nr:ATP-binding protein [Faecalibacterium sp.]
MRTKRELYQTAIRTVAARRQAARVRSEDERAYTYAAVPGLKQAEEEFRACGIRAAMCGASGAASGQALEQLKEAKAKMTRLLAESGRPADWLEPRFTCKKCKDTGTLNGETCSCVVTLMKEMRRKEIEELSSLSIQSFDTMELRYYPDRKDPVTGRNQRRYMQQLLDDLRAYAEDFDHDSANLLLFGNAGLGKTHAALSIAGEVLNKGYDVIYISSPDFFGRVEELHFDNDPTGEKEALIDAVTGADLLILDDLGTEMVSPYMISVFYTLLNNRMAARRPTIFTTNITDGAVLEKRYTEKISSRLSGSCEPFVFLGDDIRALRAAE